MDATKRKALEAAGWKFGDAADFLEMSDEEHQLLDARVSLALAIRKQREALELQISEARDRELAAAVAQVRGLIAEFGLTQQEVFPVGRGARTSASIGVKVAPKYRDPATGQTWTGRGKAPKWIQNEDREKFAI